jgi:capsular exopolysaccharide synthesis family protein
MNIDLKFRYQNYSIEQALVKEINDQNDYEILDVKPGADADEIHKAYIRAKQALKPASMGHYSLISKAEKEELRIRIEKAYSNLVDQKERESYADRFSLDMEALEKPIAVSSEAKDILFQHYGKIVDHFSFYAAKTRSILIASAQSQEGRTTTALHLAFTAALMQPGHRILLVDLDLRNSDLHRLLGLPESPGMRELLCGLNPLEDCIYTTQLPNLRVAPSGKKNVNLPGVLRGEMMKRILKKVATSFDLVFCDSPPVDDYTDVLALSRIADAVLMVIRSKISSTAKVINAKKAMSQAGDKVIGVVMNDFHNPIPSFWEKRL